MRSSSENLSSGISVFAAVVDAGTFAAASELVGMSPPGVSRAIARLERRLKIRLFNRTTRAVSLTEEGRRFYEQVMPHLRGMEEAAAAAGGDAATVRGKLRINLDPAFLRIVLGPKLDEFMDVHPELELEFIARDHLGDLIMDGFDLALRFGEPRSSSLVARKLLETAVVTVASPLYIAAGGGQRSLKSWVSVYIGASNSGTRRPESPIRGSFIASAKSLLSKRMDGLR